MAPAGGGGPATINHERAGALIVGDVVDAGVGRSRRAAALNQLWGGPETVVVVSSDLSHFHDDETARRRAAATAAMIESGDWARLPAGSLSAPICPISTMTRLPAVVDARHCSHDRAR